MRQVLAVLIIAGSVMLSASTPAVRADERADWGVAVWVAAADGTTLVLANDRGFHLVVVDTAAELSGAGLRAMALTDIHPGDRVDYAVSTWAGMDIADTLFVTPRHRLAQAKF